MTEIYYEIVAYTDNNKMVYISKDDKEGIRLTSTPVTMNKDEVYPFMNYITDYFSAFKHLRLMRFEETHNTETDDIDCIYDIEIEVFR